MDAVGDSSMWPNIIVAGVFHARLVRWYSREPRLGVAHARPILRRTAGAKITAAAAGHAVESGGGEAGASPT
ncbi:MAG: hypothetical protein U0575_16715 [Phycisphaerales bacterium]